MSETSQGGGNSSPPKKVYGVSAIQMRFGAHWIWVHVNTPCPKTGQTIGKIIGDVQGDLFQLVNVDGELLMTVIHPHVAACVHYRLVGGELREYLRDQETLRELMEGSLEASNKTIN